MPGQANRPASIHKWKGTHLLSLIHIFYYARWTEGHPWWEDGVLLHTEQGDAHAALVSGSAIYDRDGVRYASPLRRMRQEPVKMCIRDSRYVIHRLRTHLAVAAPAAAEPEITPTKKNSNS